VFGSLLFGHHLSAQSVSDSLAIKFMGAVNLTDSICSQLPDSMIRCIINCMVDHRLNTSEYYTKYLNLRIFNGKRHVSLLRMAAITDLYRSSLRTVDGKNSMPIKVGISRGKCDEIIVVLDISLPFVRRIDPAE